MSQYTSEIRVRLVQSNMFSATSNFPTKRSKSVLLLWILFCYLCFVFVCVILSCLFLACLWSPVGKELTALVYDVFLSLCHYPIWCPGFGVVPNCIDS